MRQLNESREGKIVLHKELFMKSLSSSTSSRNKQCWYNSGDSDCCSKDQEKCNKKAQKKYQLLEAKMKNLEEENRNLPSELNQSKERESRMQKSTMALSYWMLIPLQTTPYYDEDSVEGTGK